MDRKQMLAWQILEKGGEEDLKLFCSGSWVKFRTHIIYPSFFHFASGSYSPKTVGENISDSV